MVHSKKNLLTGLIYILLYSTATAQPNKIDSLRNTLLANKQEDTNKVNTLNELSRHFLKKGIFDSAYTYAEKAKQIAEKKSFRNGIASSLNYIAAVHEQQGNYTKAEKSYLTALKIRTEIGDKAGIANCYSNLGTIYMRLYRSPEALNNYFAALKIRQELQNESKQINSKIPDGYKDRQKEIAAIYNSIGNVHKNNGNFAEALKFYFSSLKIAEEIESKYGIALLNNNIGIIFKEQGNYTEARKHYLVALKIKEELGQENDAHYSNILCNIGNIFSAMNNNVEARNHYYKALKIRENLGDKLAIADCYHSIGNTYSLDGKFHEALEKLFAALKLREETEELSGVVASNIDIGHVYTKMKRNAEAYEYASKGLKLALKIRHKEWIQNAYMNMAELDSLEAVASKNKGRWQEAAMHFSSAYLNYRNYILYRDSLLYEENTGKIVQVQMNYEFEKNEAIKKQEQWKKEAKSKIELDQKEKQRNYFIIGFAIMFLLSIVTFRIYRQTQKANKIISFQKRLADQKQKEILDSIHYAKRIQQVLLPSDLLIEKTLIRMKNKCQQTGHKEFDLNNQ